MTKTVPVIEIDFPLLPGTIVQVRTGNQEIDRGFEAAGSQGLSLVVPKRTGLAGGGIGVLTRMDQTVHPLFQFELIQLEALGRARVTGELSADGTIEVEELEEAPVERDDFAKWQEDLLPVLHRQGAIVYAEHGQELSLDQLRQEMPTVETLVTAQAGPVQVLIGWVFGFLEIQDMALAKRLLGIDHPKERLDELADFLKSRPEPQTEGPAAVREILSQFSGGKLPYARMEALPVDSPEVVDELIRGLSHAEWRAVMACVKALGQAEVKQEDAARAVGGLLSHPEESVREAAVQSLCEIGRAAAPAVPALLETFRTDSKLSVFKHTFQALARIDSALDQVAPFLLKFLELAADSRDYYEVFPKLGNPNTEEFVSCYHSEPPREQDHPYVDPYADDFSVVEQACRAAGHFAARDDRLFAPLSRMLRVYSTKVIRAAAESMAALGPRGEQALLEVLKDPAGWKHDNAQRVELWRSEILGALLTGCSDPAGCLPELCRQAQDDPWLQKQLPSGISTASYRMSAQDKAVAARALLASPGPLAAELALRLLGSLEKTPEEFQAPLLNLLKNGSASLQAAAIRLLTGLQGDRQPRREVFSKMFQAGGLDPQVSQMLRHALGRMGAPQPPPPGVLSAPEQLQASILLNASPSGWNTIAWVDKNRIFFPWHRVLQSAPADQWMTDQDEFGVGELDLDAGSCVLHRLPLRFPMLQTGAAGAKRKLHMRAVVNDGMVVSLEDPYYAQGRWGNHNYLYRFSFTDNSFSRLVRTENGLAREVSLKVPPDGLESSDHNVCHGELILWVDQKNNLRLEGDPTPYHLDDWEHSQETSPRLEAQRNFQERFLESIPRLEIHPDGPGQYRLERKSRTIRLADIEACLPGESDSEQADLPELEILEALEVRSVLALLCTTRPRLPGQSAWALLLKLP